MNLYKQHNLELFTNKACVTSEFLIVYFQVNKTFLCFPFLFISSALVLNKTSFSQVLFHFRMFFEL